MRGDGDFTLGAIGFASDCPDVATPGSPSSCAVSIGALQDIVDCVTEFKAGCLDPVAVPALKSYPPECNPMPTPTP